MSNPMQPLDEKGFVFLDRASTPYLCRIWNEEPWLFYWHADNHWVSLQRVGQTDIWSFPHNLTEQEQQHYQDQHQKWENEY